MSAYDVGFPCSSTAFPLSFNDLMRYPESAAMFAVAVFPGTYEPVPVTVPCDEAAAVTSTRPLSTGNW